MAQVQLDVITSATETATQYTLRIVCRCGWLSQGSKRHLPRGPYSAYERKDSHTYIACPTMRLSTKIRHICHQRIYAINRANGFQTIGRQYLMVLWSIVLVNHQGQLEPAP